MYINIEHNKWKIGFLALSFHNNKVLLTLDHSSLTLENVGPRINDSWDSDPSENHVYSIDTHFNTSTTDWFLKTLWEKKKLLITSNFFFSHNVFYSSR